MRSRAQPRGRDTRGTSLVEVVVAMMVLTGTLLGMASVATLANRQMVTAEFMMERDAARRMTIEFLRALPYDSVRDGSDVLGGYQMAWTVTPEGPRSKALVIVTTGPGLEVRPPSVSSGIFPDVTDTVSHRVLRP